MQGNFLRNGTGCDNYGDFVTITGSMKGCHVHPITAMYIPKMLHRPHNCHGKATSLSVAWKIALRGLYGMALREVVTTAKRFSKFHWTDFFETCKQKGLHHYIKGCYTSCPINEGWGMKQKEEMLWLSGRDCHVLEFSYKFPSLIPSLQLWPWAGLISVSIMLPNR